MKINILQPKRALFVALVILLSMAGMTKVMAQVSNLTKVSEFNIQSLRTIEERVSLLHYIQQSEVFSYVYNDAEGKFDIFIPQDYTCDEANESPDFDMFLENWQDEWTAYSNLDKQERGRLYVEWRYQLDDNTFRAANEDFYELWRNNRDGNYTCDGALPFCSDNGIYDFPANINVPNMGSNDPYYCSGVEHQGQDNCLYTSPNPAFYYMRIANPGDLDILIYTEPAHDVDFDCWGPFDDPEAACNQLSCSNMVDCSYSAASTEHCHINNAQTGQCYILMITNYSNQPCNILFENQGTGSTDWELLPPIVNNDGPYCVGETIHLTAIGVAGATYSWTGPNNFRSRYQNPNRSNCTMAMAGPYICTIAKNGRTASDTTWVEVHPKPIASFTATNVDVGHATQFNSTSTAPSGYNISSYEWDFGDGQTATGATLSHTYVNAGTYPVTLTVSTEYCTDEITQDVTVNVVPTAIIYFADANVKALCVANWDTNGDGELSYGEAMAVTSLGEVFKGKNITTFKELQFFTGLTSIGANAFSSCSSLYSITIPISVTAIGNNAFYGCSSLASIVIPSSVASIGSEVFRDCPGLSQMIVNTNNSVFDSRNNCNAIIETATNKLIYGCKNTVIPNSVTSIGGAFDGCSSLTSITIPSAVTSIGSYAFYGCIRMTSMTVFAARPPSLGSSVFYNVNKSIPVNVGSCDALVAYRNASGWNEFTNIRGGEIFESEFTVTTCDIYEWNGQVYSESGDYQQTFTSAIGCDSIVTLHLINNSETEDFTMVACESYTWNGITYGASGDYIQEFTSMYGCDSIVTLHLTISDAIQTEFTQQVCDSYIWNGTWYTASGDYTQQFTSVQGCDSIVTLHLTINYREEVEFNVSECDSYTWNYYYYDYNSQTYYYGGNGQTYAESGTYTWTGLTEQGCTRTETLYLTINNSEWEECCVTECDSYTWAFGNGQTYTESGDYVWNTTTAQGCDKTVTLHLTINNSEWEEYTVTANDSYTWHGTTYTQSGTYYYETTTAQGCWRTEILHLTIDGNHWIPVADGQYPFAMTLYGVVSIDGVEQTNNQLKLGVFCGDECRGTAMVSEFFLTHRYLVEVNVYGDSGEQLTFKLYDYATHQELNLTPPAPITFTIDGYGNPINPYVLNFTSSVNIAATTAPEGAGVVTGMGEYTMGSTCTLTATANTGFQFQNWTLNGTVVSTSSNYTFTVTGAANYVAHFQYVQSRTLVAGWNWWSTYIEQNGSNGLEMLENSLGTSGIRIQGKNNSVDYFEYQGTGYWYGSLNTLTNEQMYMIRTSAACDAVIVGDAALPSNHPITINGGWNWIGYPYSQSVNVDAAMAGFSPEPNDVIKGRSNASMYLSYGGYQGWYGQLNTLEPGQGYMYRSYSDATKMLTFQTGRGGETLANITPESNVFVPNTDNYSDNMIVTAVIDMEGAELRLEDYELAAFAGNECRGSVKLMYVEPYDRYVALLMAYGEGGEELRFVLTDGEGTSWSNDRVTYTANGMVGTMTEPTVLHFGPMGTEDNLQKPIHVYPNPSNGIFNIEGEGIQKIEVIDIYGQVILSKEVKNANHKVDLSDKAAGAYLLRVVTVDGIVTHKLIKDN